MKGCTRGPERKRSFLVANWDPDHRLLLFSAIGHQVEPYDAECFALAATKRLTSPTKKSVLLHTSIIFVSEKNTIEVIIDCITSHQASFMAQQ